MPLSRCRLIVILGTTLSVFGYPGASSARVADSQDVVVRTAAGPGFCPTPARLDPSSTAVRSLAVGPDGTLFFDAGRPGDGIIARVGLDATTRKLVSGPPPEGDAKWRTGTGSGRIAPDGQGGVLVAQGTRLVVIDQDNGLATIAGDPSYPGRPHGAGSSGDGGPANQARFTFLRSITTDAAHNVFVADGIDPGKRTFRIRFINRSGEPVTFHRGTDSEVTVAPGNIDTIAGSTGRQNPAPGMRSRGARSAPPVELAGSPPALAAGPGRLFLAVTLGDSGRRARRSEVYVINLGGEALTTQGVAVGPGEIEGINRLPSRTQSPARRGSEEEPDFGYVPGIGVDPEGNLYLADHAHHRVLRIDPGGKQSILAGTGRRGDSGDHGPARRARLNRPVDVRAGPAGRVYVSDAGNNRVRVVDMAGDIRPAPGNGVARIYRCAPIVREKQAANSRSPLPMPDAGGPAGVAADSRGNIYFALALGHQVKKLEPSGRVTTVAGAVTGNRSCPAGRVCPGFGGDGGPAPAARLASPTALAMSPSGNLYVLDSGNARVRFINLGRKPVSVHGIRVPPGAIQTVAGNGKAGLGGDGGPARKARLGTLGSDAFSAMQNFLKLPLTIGFSPDLSLGALAVDSSGNLYIADSGYVGLDYAGFVKIDASNHRVRKVDPAGTISTFAGEGAPPGRDACCKDPTGLALDASGNLYVSDRGAAPEGTLPSAGLAANTDPMRHPRVWVVNTRAQPISILGQKVEPNGVAAVVGSGAYGFGGDGGPATRAGLLAPSALATRPGGEMYLAEYGTSETGDVRRIAPDGTIGRIVGNGQYGFNGDGLRGLLTSLNYPVALALDACGDLLLADLGNDRIRRLDLQGSCPPPDRSAGPVRVPSGRAPVIAGAAFVIAVLGWLYLRSRRTGSEAP